MSENDNEKDLLNNEESEETTKEFVLEDFDLNPVSSAETVKTDEWAMLRDTETEEVLPEPETPEILAVAEDTEEEVDPIFAELAAPVLPDLEKENRARLQMQSPNRLYFYWSIKNNPFQTLQKVFGGDTNYQLVAKLINQSNDREEMHAVDAEGNWWFNVESDTEYRAEIGFYAPNRPYFRVMFSNTIETPRKSPSPRAATDADWAVSAATFAEVLDISGFARDAFEVALAGDDAENAEFATENAFRQLVGEGAKSFSAEEVRYALLALASGISLEELRGQISESLFSVLQENIDKLSAENALAALKEHFDIFDEEFFEEEEELGAAVYGASLVNFPSKRRKRTTPKTLSPKFKKQIVPHLSPISSLR